MERVGTHLDDTCENVPLGALTGMRKLIIGPGSNGRILYEPTLRAFRACLISGICGVLTPLVLKRLGADPATASSIFLTTFTDVASMGTFLGLATLLIL